MVCKTASSVVCKSWAMTGTKGMMENLALPMANVPSINIHRVLLVRREEEGACCCMWFPNECVQLGCGMQKIVITAHQ